MTRGESAFLIAILCFALAWFLYTYALQNRRNRDIEGFLVDFGEDELESTLV